MRALAAKKSFVITIFCFALILYYVYLVTLGEFTFISPTHFGMTFNSQWDHLSHGRFDIDSAVTNEVYIVDGKAVIYWGIFPALIRGLLTLFYDLSLPVGRASILLAVLVLTISNIGSALSLGLHKGRTSKIFWLLAAVLCVGNGYLTIVAPPHPYHECILWGAANLSLFNMLLLRFAINPHSHPVRKLAFLGGAAAVTLLSRVPEGTCAFVTLAILGIVLTLRQLGLTRYPLKGVPQLGYRGLVTVAAIWFLAGSLHLFVNYERFGNPFETQPTEKLSYYRVEDERMAAFRKYGLWQWDRIPVGFEYYFVPHADNFVSKFPFLAMSETVYTKPFAMHIDWIEPRSEMPLAVTSLFFLVFGIMGFSAISAENSSIPTATREVFIAGAIGNSVIWLLMFGYTGFCYRYVADIITPLVFMTFIALYYWKTTNGRSPAIPSNKLFWLSFALAAITIYSSLATYCIYVAENGFVAVEERKAMYDRFIKPFRGLEYDDKENELKFIPPK